MKKTKVFFDTNILAYANDERDPSKQAIARNALGALADKAVVSTQVLLELYNTLANKFKKDPILSRRVVEVFALLDVVGATSELALKAIDTSILNQISVWDAMIIEAAVEGRCDVIYSEDLNHGQSIRGVKIINPFLS